MSLHTFLKESQYFFTDPKTYARRGSIRTKKIFHHLYRFLNFGKYLRARQFAKRMSRENVIVLNPDDGFLIVNGIVGENIIDAAVHAANELLKDNPVSPDDDRHMISFTPNDLGLNSPFTRLALHPEIIKTLSYYTSLAPVVDHIAVIYSPNKRLTPDTSQFFHLDGQDIHTLHLFVYASDVDEDAGPLTLIKAKASEKIARIMNYRKVGDARRLLDDVVDPLIDPTDKVVFTGKAGHAFLFDSDRCFHYGSRAGRKPRLIILISYRTPFAFVVTEGIYPQVFR